MKVYLVANPKGGSGKSTLATNLAGLLAHREKNAHVMLGDVDRQQSAAFWLQRRPPNVPVISNWEVEPGKPARPPRGTTHAVLDTPAGLHDEKLKALLKVADRVLVPVQPSMFDLMASQAFFEELAEIKVMRSLPIAVVGLRVDERTRSAEQFHRFIESTGLPLLTSLRNTQNYVQLAAHGLTLFDVAPHRVEKDLAQWEAFWEWV
ncbi:MAG: cobyrinic acid a,c-diamide synthase [Rhodocyclales bacterium]|nr:cobyrinic acid a,c-diamide synthase [Rhodocyclales bacterium]MDB5887234.1 cobyrinic acid a,c-diamide synthase [Rhodocyclales bacterium]